MYHSTLLQQAISSWRANPSKTAIVCGGQVLSFAQLSAAVTMASQAIHARLDCRSLRPSGSHRVAFVSANSFECVATVFACAFLGCLCAPINPDLAPQQQSHILDSFKPDLLVVADSLETPGLSDWDGLCSFSDLFPSRLPDLTPSPDAAIAQLHDRIDVEALSSLPFLLTYSSGSTGNPKAIVFSQACKYKRFLQAATTWNLSAEDVIINASPLHHSLGMRLTLLPLLLGATLLLMPRFEVHDWLKLAHEHGLTFTIPVTSHLFALQNEASFLSLLSSGVLKAMVSSSAPLEGALRSQLLDGPSGSTVFYEMYGASEIGTATLLDFTDPASPRESVGRPLPDVSLRIVDPNGDRELPMGQKGEICVRTPLVFAGYLDDPERTDAAFVDRFFRTGDLGCLDEAGYLYYAGRQADAFTVGGINVYAEDIEKGLSDHPEVAQVKVVPVAHDYFGQVPVAFVVPRHLVNSDRLARKLRVFAVKSLADYQVPHRVFVLDSFPLLASGKLDRRALVSQAAEYFKT